MTECNGIPAVASVEPDLWRPPMRVGIYPRKSVYRDNSDSVAVQVKMCKNYAAIIYPEQEIEFHIYDQDEGFSGKNTNRPSYQELMSDVRNNLLDVVIVYKLDRISRNVQEFSAMFEILQRHGVSFISVKEAFDTSTPIGRTVMYILAAFAQLERENTSERVTDNMQSLGANGKWTGGKCPAGMTSIRRVSGGKEHSYLVVDPDTVWRVKLLYSLLLSGRSITGIERYCRDNSITSATGKFLSASQIYNIISNPVYCQADSSSYDYFQELGCRLPESPRLFDGAHGLIAYGRTKQGTSGQRRSDTRKWHISVGIHDYVLPSDQWLEAQKRLAANKQDRSNKYQVGILKGILRCGCGSRMCNRVYVKNEIQFAYYYCEAACRKGSSVCQIHYYRIDEIDSLFINKLKSIRLNPEYIKLQSDTQEILNADSIQADLKTTAAAISNLTLQLQENLSSPASKYIIGQIEGLDKKLNALKARQRRAQLQLQKAGDKDQQTKRIYENIAYLLKHFDNMDYTEKNECVKRITQKCVLDGEHLEITF